MQYKELSWSKKIEFIWDYYKFPILAVLFVTIMTVWITITVWENKNRVYALDISIVGSQVDTKAASDLRDTIQAYFKEMGIEGEVIVDPIDLKAVDPNVQLANNAKFFSKTSTNTVDILINFGDAFPEYAQAGLFAPLDELFSAGTIKMDEDFLVRDKITDPDITNEIGKEQIYGLDMTLNPKLNGLTDPANGLIVSIYTNSKKKENAIAVLKWLLQ